MLTELEVVLPLARSAALSPKPPGGCAARQPCADCAGTLFSPYPSALCLAALGCHCMFSVYDF